MIFLWKKPATTAARKMLPPQALHVLEEMQSGQGNLLVDLIVDYNETSVGLIMIGDYTILPSYNIYIYTYIYIYTHVCMYVM